MLPLAYQRQWQIANVVLLILVLAATVMPAVWFWDDRVQFVRWFRNIDKWAHGITFLFLAIWFAGQYRKTHYWRIAIGLLAFGGLIEAIQRLLSYRSAEWLDMAANSAGILLGLTVAAIGLGGWCLVVERWLPGATRPG